MMKEAKLCLLSSHNNMDGMATVSCCGWIKVICFEAPEPNRPRPYPCTIDVPAAAARRYFRAIAEARL